MDILCGPLALVECARHGCRMGGVRALASKEDAVVSDWRAQNVSFALNGARVSSHTAYAKT